MATIASLAVSITARTLGLEKGLDAAGKKVDGFAKKSRYAGQKVDLIGSGVQALQASLPALSVGGIAALVKSSIDAADQMRDMAIKTGTTTEFLSQMQHAANLTGVEFSTFTGSLTRMQNSLVNIARSDKATEQLAALGINVGEIMKLKPEEQFLAIGEALQNIKDPAVRTNTAIKIFGRSGAELGKLFAEGGTGIAAMRAEADSLGLTIGTDTADAADAANDAIVKLQGSFKGLTQTLALELAAPLANVVELLSRGLPVVGKFVSASVESVGQVIGGLAASNAELFRGNFRGALDIVTGLPGDVGQNFDGLLDENKKQTEELRDIARNIRKPPAAVAG